MKLAWAVLIIFLSLGGGAGEVKAQSPCQYMKSGDGVGDTGVAVEQGVVTCTTSSYTHQSNVFIATIDLTTPGRFLTTSSPTSTPAKSGVDIFTLQLPTDYLASLGQHRVAPEPYGPTGQIAVNANLFTNSPVYSKSKGLATGIRGMEVAMGRTNVGMQGNPDFSCFYEGGKCFRRLYNASLLVSGNNNAVIIYTGNKNGATSVRAAWAGPATVVTGSNMLVYGGVGVAPSCGTVACTTEFFGPNSRTGVGLTRDRKTLVLVVADSRSEKGATETGLQLDELAWLMLQRNAFAAINMDGGGSSLMAVRNGLSVQALNRPRQDNDGTQVCDSVVNGGCQRYVGNSLGVGYFRPALQAR